MAECYNKVLLPKKKIWVNCGKCLNCLENRKNEAFLRFMLETQKMENRYFITLTYTEWDADRDENGLTVLNKLHLKRYIDRIQKRAKRYYGEGIKWMGSGEYGQRATKRAHYHVVLASNCKLDFYLKTAWKMGNVKVERVKDNRAIRYTSGYSIKKMGRSQNERGVQPFVKWSRGLGSDWIHKAIAKGKFDDPKNYFIDTVMGRFPIPTYFKRKIKEYIMKFKIKYRKSTEEEFNKYKTKTIMIDKHIYITKDHYWKEYIDVVKEKMREKDLRYYASEYFKEKYGDKWDERFLNMMYNPEWEEMDEIERCSINWLKRKKVQLKYAAEMKEHNKKARSLAA